MVLVSYVLPGRYLSDYKDELLRCRNDLPLRISSISLGYRGSLLSADPNIRTQCRKDIKELLSLCGDLGTVGLVIPPILNQDTQGSLTAERAGDTAKSAQDRLLLTQLPELADYAQEHGVTLLLEPVNRFETDYLNTIGHALTLCRKLEHPGLAITADFFHMQIEELNPIAALAQAGKWIKHVHIAENTRVEPGPGNLKFLPLFRTLRDIEYDGYVVTECRSLSRPPDQALPCSAQYIRGMIRRCQQ